MTIIDISHKNSINDAKKTLLNNGVIIFPTDTVYGIGCQLENTAIRKLYKIKNRPLTQPTAILLTEKIYHKIRPSKNCVINIPKDVEKSFFDGRVTIIFPISIFEIEIPKMIIKDNRVGIRLPQYKWVIDLINKTGPVVASSANKKGGRTPTKYKELNLEILEKADLVVKTSKKLSGKPSAIYDLKLGKYLR